MLIYVHRDHIKDYSGRGAQDGHLHLHTAPELCNFSVALCPQRPYRLLQKESPERPPRAPERCTFSVALRPQRLHGLLGTGSPGWSP